jgi:hypothetical protein
MNYEGGQSVIINIDSERTRLRKRELLLRELKRAVCLQIELWEAVETLEDLTDSDFDPLIWIQAASTDVDTGTDLTMSDVDDYLHDDD